MLFNRANKKILVKIPLAALCGPEYIQRGCSESSSLPAFSRKNGYHHHRKNSMEFFCNINSDPSLDILFVLLQIENRHKKRFSGAINKVCTHRRISLDSIKCLRRFDIKKSKHLTKYDRINKSTRAASTPIIAPSFETLFMLVQGERIFCFLF